MNKCVADNNNIIKQYNFTNNELRNIIKKERIIKNLNVSKTEINRANKTTLNNIINDYNIDINKDYYDRRFIRDFNKFMRNVEYYNYGNNIYKSCKNRKLIFVVYINYWSLIV